MSASPAGTVSYVVVTPVRDEERYIEKTLDSMAAQTVRPLLWIIVDDGSADSTARIVDRFCRRHPWTRLVRAVDHGRREPGTGVIRAFNIGFQEIETLEWDFVVKLDGDLSFEEAYFEKCFQAFSEEERLGIAGGAILNLIEGQAVPEPGPSFHVRGATKIYRRACWEAIGGLSAVPGWDTLDEVKANMLGWSTRTLEHLEVLHLRPTGAAQGSWRDSVKNGLANYVTGYHPVFMLAKCAGRIARRPYLLHSAGLLYGFLGGYVGRTQRIPDPQLIRYVRQQQMKRLWRQESIWR